MSNKVILLLAFLEGISVMIIELIGGKMLVPYYGNSLIIWTSTIGVTMSSLMVGYYLGGYLSMRKKKLPYLYGLITLSAFWIIIMPSIIFPIIQHFGDSNLHTASILSSISLFAFPLILLGATPAILIEQLTTEKNAGTSSGKIFFTSTLGAIFSALFTGFFIISKYGLSSPIIIYGVFLFVVTTILLWKTFNDKIFFFIISIPIFLFSFSSLRKNTDPSSLYHSESLQGQLKVVDQPGGKIGMPRYLQINGVSQTRMFLDFNNPSSSQSGWWYVHLDAALASHVPKNSNTLLMGFGGGSIATELVKLEMKLDVVEIDERLPEIAYDYFLFDTTGVNFYIDDARHFIKKNQTTKKYDLILIDLLHGEVQPNHIFTVEGLQELRQLATENATIIVNYQSNQDEPEKPYLAILNTLWAAGYDAILTDYVKDRPADYIFVASPNSLPDNLFDKFHMNDCCFNNKNVQGFILDPKFITKDSKIILDNPGLPILTDDAPILETMNKETIITWRENMIEQTKVTDYSLFK